MSGRFLRNLLLGKDFIESRSEYKYGMLRGQFGLLIGAICFTYIIIDSYNGVYDFLPFYLLGIGVTFVIVYMNRQRRTVASSMLILIFANILIYCFAAIDSPYSGVFLYFCATAAASMVLFGATKRALGFTFAFISLALGLIAFFVDWSPIPKPYQTEFHIQVNFITNFIIGLVTCALIVQFAITRNNESERTLLANQEKLQKLSADLQVSQERFRLAVEGTRAGIYEWWVTKNNISVSDRYKQLLGYDDPDEIVIDMSFYRNMVHPEDADRVAQYMQECLAQGGAYHNEYRIKLKNGDFHWFLDTGIVNHVKGAPHYVVGSIIDINDRKKAEQALLQKNEELEKANTELDRFVYSASHDMRAPLSSLLGLMEIVRLTNKNEELDEYFDRMRKRILTMEGFIKEITDYSRNARLEVVNDQINLYDLVQEVVDSVEFLVPEKKVKRLVNIPRDYQITTDSARLRVILSNLVTNSIKYSDPKKDDSFFRISVNEEDHHHVIVVEDNGIGIDAQYLARIFDMFFRATEMSDGSGLGLYIVKEVTQKLNGEIKFESVLGQGSTFTVLLPK